MNEENIEIDAALLQDQFNPFYPICEANRDQREVLHEYRAYKDYLQFLKIIGIRLIIDSVKYEKTRFMNALTEYELQLDSDSFVIFSRILLNNVGLLMDRLLSCRNAHTWSNSFSDHRDDYLKDNTLCPQYSEILAGMHWYEQNLNYLRDKIIVHGRSLAGSMRNFSVYRKINKSFGMLSTADQGVLQNLINKYGQKYSLILSIQPNPNTMLDEFLRVIMELNIELSHDDLSNLGQIVQRNGAAIDVGVLSKHIRKFLEDTAALFQPSK